MGRLGAKLVEHEEETQAQNKVAFGLLSLLLVYPATFFFLWALLWYTPIGAVVAAVSVYLFAIHHNRMIDSNYERAKRFIAAWRVLVGVWTPKRWDLSMAALSHYTKPRAPPPSPWIDRPTTPTTKVTPTEENQAKKTAEDFSIQPEPPVKSDSPRRLPSRRLVRHVLRSRVEAMNALAGFFDQLARAGREKKVQASPHLARMFGGGIVEASYNKADESVGEAQRNVEGWRYAAEVLTFLGQHGAKIPTLGKGPLEDEWALSSEGEGYITGDEQEEPLWVPRTID